MSSRNCFEYFLDINSTSTSISNYNYTIDNVIQIKLRKDDFKNLFKCDNLIDNKYNSNELLNKLKLFFSNEFNNYNIFTSDISIIIQNTFKDIDINSSLLEKECKENGYIFNYYFLSECISFSSSTSSNKKVYEIISFALEDMINSSINNNNSFSDKNDEFWNNIPIGDSIFINGNFNISFDINIPITLQFVSIDSSDVIYEFI